MGIFGKKKNVPPPHPRREPRYDCPLTADDIAADDTVLPVLGTLSVTEMEA